MDTPRTIVTAEALELPPLAPRRQQGDPPPCPGDWDEVARLLLLSRAMDDLEERELVPTGKVRYQFSARGHELAQIILGLSLDHPNDGAAVYYRSRPFMLASGLTVEEALCGSMARTGGTSGGRDIGVVFNMPPRGRATVIPMTGDVGGQYSPAAGWAQSIRYNAETLHDPEWQGAITVVLGGDGSVATPGFWSALNIATTQALPLLFFIEDNGYAISVPSTLQVPGGDIAANLAAYQGLLVLEGDGADPREAAASVQRALAHVRGGTGPALLRLRVPRLNGHSFNDNQAYKDEHQREEEQRRDPLGRLRDFLIDSGWLPARWDALADRCRAEVTAAAERAAANAHPEPASVTQFVFSDPARPQKAGGRRGTGDWGLPSGSSTPAADGPRINMVDAIRQTLASELARNERMLIFGEDVGRKGGVHGATRDLQHQFGAQRVFDTSLNEEGIIGRAVGMALAGLLPVPEIQFRKYLAPAMEQVDDCGTLRWRSNNNFGAPLVVRIPGGFSKVTGDPWHSMSGEAVLAHTVGWRIAMPSNAADAVGLLRAALRGNDPVFFFEHRALLDTPEGRRPYPGDDYVLPFGQAALRQSGDVLTVVTWGAMVARCIEAAQPFAGAVEIIDLRTIVPWDRETVLASVEKTGKCMVVHEDTWTAGFGGEIAATVAQEAFGALDGPVVRVAAPDCPVPYSAALVSAVVPGVDLIRRRMKELLEW
ncbi:MAG: transketolase C-terminal domain-containing protein [Roseiflexaceae bacterium]